MKYEDDFEGRRCRPPDCVRWTELRSACRCTCRRASRDLSRCGSADRRCHAALGDGNRSPLSEELTTNGKKLRVGNRFRLEVAEPVVVNGAVVVPAGSPAVGEITDVRNKGMWGKSGRLVTRLLYTTVNGRQIRLSGGFDDKGTAGGIGAVAVSAIVFPPAGFFMTGTSAKVAMGTVVKGFIDEDVPLAMPAEALAPLQVGTPTALPATTAAVGTE